MIAGKGSTVTQLYKAWFRNRFSFDFVSSVSAIRLHQNNLERSGKCVFANVICIHCE